MKLVKTPRRAATLKNSKQLHYEASGKAEVGAAFIFSLFTYLHSGAGDGTRPLVYTRLAVCQVSPTLLTTGSRCEALCCRSSFLLSVIMYHNFSVQSKVLWRQRNLQFDFISVSFIWYFPWKNVFLSVQLSACSILSSQVFVPTINFPTNRSSQSTKLCQGFLREKEKQQHFFFCCKLISNVVRHLNFRDNFLNSYCFRKCGAGYRAVRLLTFAAPVSGIRRSSDILTARNNTVSPLFLLLLYAHTISSIYRTCFSADTGNECPFLKVSLKNFSVPLYKMTFHSSTSAVRTSSCASQ